MRSISARFDDPNLVSCAGLVPIAALAERAGLPELLERLSVPASNAATKLLAVVLGMVAGADSITDLNVLRHGAMRWHTSHQRLDRRTFEGLQLVDTPVSTRVWWRCAAGHQWQESISQRLSTVAKWKNGDPASCRSCVGPLPGDLVEHTFPCGHTVRTRRATAALGRPRCWPCEQPYRDTERGERKRTAARESYQRVRDHGRPSDEERRAQRRLVGLLNCTRVLADDHGIAVVRDDDVSAVLGGMDSRELSELLILLQVPHTVQGPDATAAGLAPGKAQVRVAWTDLDALERWAPTTARRARGVRDGHHLGPRD